MELWKFLEREKIVPVIKLDTPSEAEPLAGALTAGGINVAEVTFRTEAAAGSIRAIRDRFPEMLVGAGTVLTVENARKAMDSGAAFVVAPGFNPEIVRYCQEGNMPVVPGVCTPSEVEQAMALGLRYLKFFPAELSGGIAMLKTLGSVYGAVFMPTGGLSESNFLDYLRLKNVIACGGSWMVREDLIRSGRFDEITSLSRKVRALLDEAFSGGKEA